MLKQILSKIPRKSLKSDSLDSSESHHGQNGNFTSARTPSVKRTSSAIFPSSSVSGMEPLLAFKDVPNSEKINLFISKLNLCSVVFDFNCLGKNNLEKDLKRKTLIELADFVAYGSFRFSEPAIISMCKMCEINLFRIFVPHYRYNSNENDFDEPEFDPAWPHLYIVYDLLLKFINSSCLEAKVARKYIDYSFILKLLDLFDSEDPRERECLKTILHRIYGKFMIHRPFIRKAISNIFYSFVFETERHNGISELLEVFGSIISGFALPLKEEHKMFLWRALIPLHKPKSLGVYFQQLWFCQTQFIEKDPKLASTVIMGLMKYWPITNSQKEVILLSELEDILEGINMIEFQKIMIPLFWRIGCCITSFHFQVAERALFFWNNDQILNLIAHNRHIILPIIFPALERNIQSHWNQVVLNLTLNLRTLFSEMDKELFLACHSQFKKEQESLKFAAQKRNKMWEQLENEADLKRAVGNVGVLVSPIAASIVF